MFCFFMVLQYRHNQYDKTDPLGILVGPLLDSLVSLCCLLPLVYPSHQLKKQQLFNQQHRQINNIK